MGSLDLSSLRFDALISREWLASNGNGGYASSTICGLNTRKYHGLLVAAMAPPVRRMVLLSRMEETILLGGQAWDLAANEYPGVIHPRGDQFLRAFSHEPFPRWAYQSDGWTIEKQLCPIQGENTVLVRYTLLGGNTPVDLELRPLFALRGIHELMYQWNGKLDVQESAERHYRLPATSRTPELFFAHDGAFSSQPCWYLNTIYRREQERGYAGLEDLWMPGVIRARLLPGQSIHFACSTEPIDLLRVIADADMQFGMRVPPLLTHSAEPALDTLLRAAAQFIVNSRQGPAIMSGYPWAAPGGRDAMICLPGLLLVPGRMAEARESLAGFAAASRNGLMPSEMAEDGSGWQYEAADTALWFVHNVGEYLRYGGDEAFVARDLYPVVQRIIETHLHGAGLGVGADADGLMRTHATGIPTTWMDAKVGDWVITPRQGRPVSINALWFNAVCIAADLSQRFGHADRAADMLSLAGRIKESFNRRFWNEAAGCCYDVVEDHGNDPSVRPNQLLAISLPYPVLDWRRHEAVLDKVRQDLLTPVGLRTLAPSDPSYQGRYAGPVVTRDRAYHQGSVFPWLLGPYITACVRSRGRGQASRDEARQLLEGCFRHLTEEGIGQLCELFDGDAPHKPGGSPASARSVAEVLRCYIEDVLGIGPDAARPLPRHEPAPQRSPLGDQVPR